MLGKIAYGVILSWGKLVDVNENVNVPAFLSSLLFAGIAASELMIIFQGT